MSQGGRIIEHMFESIDERALVLAIVETATSRWHQVAALLEAVGSARRLLQGDVPDDLRPEERLIATHAVESVTSESVARQSRLLEGLDGEQTSLVTVLDEGYPSLLREVYNRPPFLFVKGALAASDELAVSVVGTRTASEKGLETARRLATGLVEHGVTVVSGMAAGIDTAAHEAALDAGGRTIAVFGTGIRRVYPAQNKGLAARIACQGAVVSQFWPDAPPTRSSFPMRNVVTSAMGIGSVVIEASGTSGAKNQATHCLDHGKRLFLMRDLVLQEEWAQRYAERPGTMIVESVEEVVAVLTSIAEAPRQLSLC